MTEDERHLDLLSTFHYVVGGLAALFSLIPVIHLTIGLAVIFAPEKMFGQGQGPPPFFGWFFVIFATLAIVVGLTVAGLIIAAGRFLARRRHHMFCLVMAGIECMFMPFGTVLGIFTILVLTRPSVKEMFEAKRGAETLA